MLAWTNRLAVTAEPTMLIEGVKTKLGLSVNRLRVVDRREHQAAVRDRQVPVTRDKEITAW